MALCNVDCARVLLSASDPDGDIFAELFMCHGFEVACQVWVGFPICLDEETVVCRRGKFRVHFQVELEVVVVYRRKRDDNRSVSARCLVLNDHENGVLVMIGDIFQCQ